jgi:hypothetical protein
MEMRRLPLIAVTLLLAACDSGADPAPVETPIASETGSMSDGAGPRLDPAIAAGEIPARFHGVWDAVTGTCDPASDMRVEITARRIEYYESVGDVSGMGNEGDDAIADLVMEGEGETWMQPTRLSLEAMPDGERLRISDALKPESPDDPLRKRCPA